MARSAQPPRRAGAAGRTGDAPADEDGGGRAGPVRIGFSAQLDDVTGPSSRSSSATVGALTGPSPRTVGLSEAAVRQRVQRPRETGVLADRRRDRSAAARVSGARR